MSLSRGANEQSGESVRSLLIDNLSVSESSFSSSSEDDDEKEFYEQTLVFSVGLLVALLICIFIRSSKRLHWLHESLALLLFGVLVGAIQLVIPDSPLFAMFAPGTFIRVFYAILFPPVIFNAGFTLKQKDFVKNIGSIFTYAFLGTIISTIVLSLSIYGLNKWLDLVNLDFIESLMFGALLSPIDTVATISVLTEMNVIPLLYSLVFGESVLNDAVAIALCTALSPYVGKIPEWSTLGKIVKDFTIIVFGSVGVGAGCGFLAAFLAAQEKRFDLSVTFQSMQILILAYLSYVISEYLEISGVISLFVCAMVMSHYCWYSISENSRRSLFQLASGLDFLSELMVFVSFGILLFIPSNFKVGYWSPWFIVITLVMCFVARACNTFVLSFFLNIGRKVKIPFKCQVIMWYCGMRGIITLLLVLNFQTPNRYLLINTTFAIIFFTNFVIGLTMKPIVKAFHVGATEDKANIQDPGQQLPPEYITRAQLNTRSRFARWWFLFDNGVLKKAFGGRVRILVEDESDIARLEAEKSKKGKEEEEEEVPAAEGETELSRLHTDHPGQAEEKIGEVEFLPRSDSDESSSSSDEESKHAKIETAAESLRNFDAILARYDRHRHSHRRRSHKQRLNYGTATTSRLPLLDGKYGASSDGEEEEEDDDDDKDASSRIKTMSAVYSSSEHP